jgi:hypothetical protein
VRRREGQEAAHRERQRGIDLDSLGHVADGEAVPARTVPAFGAISPSMT